jgi:hypothetical protein
LLAGGDRTRVLAAATVAAATALLAGRFGNAARQEITS